MESVNNATGYGYGKGGSKNRCKENTVIYDFRNNNNQNNNDKRYNPIIFDYYINDNYLNNNFVNIITTDTYQ